MGMFNTFGDTQLKIGGYDNQNLDTFKIGDELPFKVEDGIYMGYDGFVVIKNNIFIAEFKHLFNNDGNHKLDLESVKQGWHIKDLDIED